MKYQTGLISVIMKNFSATFMDHNKARQQELQIKCHNVYSDVTVVEKRNIVPKGYIKFSIALTVMDYYKMLHITWKSYLFMCKNDNIGFRML